VFRFHPMKQLIGQLLPLSLRGMLLKLAPEVRVAFQAIDDNTYRVIREVSSEWTFISLVWSDISLMIREKQSTKRMVLLKQQRTSWTSFSLRKTATQESLWVNRKSKINAPLSYLYGSCLRCSNEFLCMNLYYIGGVWHNFQHSCLCSLYSCSTPRDRTKACQWNQQPNWREGTLTYRHWKACLMMVTNSLNATSIKDQIQLGYLWRLEATTLSRRRFERNTEVLPTRYQWF